MYCPDFGTQPPQALSQFHPRYHRVESRFSGDNIEVRYTAVNPLRVSLPSNIVLSIKLNAKSAQFTGIENPCLEKICVFQTRFSDYISRLKDACHFLPDVFNTRNLVLACPSRILVGIETTARRIWSVSPLSSLLGNSFVTR